MCEKLHGGGSACFIILILCRLAYHVPQYTYLFFFPVECLLTSTMMTTTVITTTIRDTANRVAITPSPTSTPTGCKSSTFTVTRGSRRSPPVVTTSRPSPPVVTTQSVVHVVGFGVGGENTVTELMSEPGKNNAGEIIYAAVLFFLHLFSR